tara:strand:- start:19668 stop:22574 length:2907 start_codon:yes stop_codon:yes gene_type:complete
MRQQIKKWLLGIFLIPLGLFAQSTVNGTITDASNGVAIPGANVIIQGTSNGTTSDFDGNYILQNVNTGDVIVFSYVGFKNQKIEYTGQASINVSMLEDFSELGEVLLIGYGSTTKQDATGAVTTVSAEEFNKGSIVSPDQLLVAKSPGVRITSNGGAPGEGSQIRIRGGSSLNASNDPLFIVDGIPLDQRGVQGVRNQLNAINPNEIEDITILKDASATAIYGSRASNGVVIITTKGGKRGSPLQVEYGIQFSQDRPQNTIDVFNAEEFRQLVQDQGANEDFLGTASTDWQDQIYRNAEGGIHDLTVTQGFEQFQYRANFNVSNKEGVLRKDLFRRTSLNLNLSSNFFDNSLKINLTTKGSLNDNVYAEKGAIGGATAFDPTQPVYSSGSAFDGFFEYTQADGSPVTLAPRNPVAQLLQDDNRARNKRNITNLNVDLKIPYIPELRFIANGGFDYSEIDGKQYIDENSATQQNGEFRNFYTGLNRNTNLDLTLNYKNNFGQIKYDVLAGHAYQEFYIRSDKSQTRDGVFGPDPTIINRNALESYFGRISFDIADKYLISASYRRDGSSRFGIDNRWSGFPAVSLGWKLTNEKFLENSNLFSNIKLRAGYGVTGNQEVSNNYAYLGVYTPGQSSASVQFGNDFVNTIRPEEFDPNLKWEETRQYNVGLDLGFFNGKLNVNLDGYSKETDDLLSIVTVPAGSNLSDLILTNVGSLKSKGAELNIDLNLAATENFSWDINANGSLQEVEITKLSLSDDEEFFVPTGDISGGVGNKIQLYKPGYDPSTFFVYRQIYDANGTPIEGAYVDVNGDNQITDADKQAYKKGTPDAYYGFSSRMTYKNFDFNFTLRGSLGNYVYNNVDSSTGYIGNTLEAPGDFFRNGSTDLLNTNFRSGQFFSDYYIQRADFLKLDNVSIGYTIPMEVITMRATLTGTNLLTITEYDGIDPEISNGIDNNFYPRPRGFVVGLNFTY